MLLATTPADFDALLDSRPPRGLGLADSALAPAEVLAMLRDLAASIAPGFEPAAWLIVEHGEVVGLCSITHAPRDGVVNIGYGIAPTRQGTGAATRAVAGVAAWARGDERVRALTAETAVDNLASQQVLARNGFLKCGERTDPEDGELVCWRLDT